MTQKEELKIKLDRLNRKICCINNDINNLLSEDIIDALENATNPSLTNVFLTEEDLDNYLPQDVIDALTGANIPSALNPYATITDIANIPDPITVVANYAALPAAATVTGEFYWAESSQGTQWLPGSLGGTYYPLGIYYSNGVSWSHIETPYQATQLEVNTGLNNTKFVTPLTLEAADKWLEKRDVSTYIYKSTLYTVANTDRTIECSGTFAVTLPLLTDITHREDITIKNSGVGIITIQTTGGELLEDTVTFPIYATESLTLQKGNTTYIVK